MIAATLPPLLCDSSQIHIARPLNGFVLGTVIVDGGGVAVVQAGVSLTVVVPGVVSVSVVGTVVVSGVVVVVVIVVGGDTVVSVVVSTLVAVVVAVSVVATVVVVARPTVVSVVLIEPLHGVVRVTVPDAVVPPDSPVPPVPSSASVIAAAGPSAAASSNATTSAAASVDLGTSASVRRTRPRNREGASLTSIRNPRISIKLRPCVTTFATPPPVPCCCQTPAGDEQVLPAPDVAAEDRLGDPAQPDRVRRP